MATLCGVTGSSGGRWIGVWIVVLMLVLGACSTELSDEIIDLTTTSSVEATTSTRAATTTSSSTIAATTTTTSVEELEVELMRVITGARFAFLEALADPFDTSDDEMGPWVTDRYLEFLEDAVVRAQSNGEATKLGEVESLYLIEAVFSDANAATVTYCLVSDSIVYSIEDGSTIDDRLGFVTTSAELLMQPDGWRVDSQSILELSLEASCVG